MIEGFKAWVSREDCWYSVVLNIALLFLGCLFLFSVHPQSRDWVLGNGYCVVTILGLTRIRNAVLIIISVTFSIICSLAFSLSSRRKHGRQGADWAPGDVEVPIVSPKLLLWGWGPFATWRGSFLPHHMHLSHLLYLSSTPHL